MDEEGAHALVETPAPVNKFPQLVHYPVRRLKNLCPEMGKARIARSLARAELHLGVTTVGRLLKAKEPGRPQRHISDDVEKAKKPRVVNAKYPNHLWHADLTAVPTGAGLCTPWLPFALPQQWPFCWWVAVVVDHFSRRVVWFRSGLLLDMPRKSYGASVHMFIQGSLDHYKGQDLREWENAQHHAAQGLEPNGPLGRTAGDLALVSNWTCVPASVPGPVT